MTYRSLVARSFAALVLTLGSSATAQEVCGDATCPKGWECTTEESSCPAVDCKDAECPVCEPTTVDVCRPGPCTSDADCDPAMQCVTEQHSVCTGGEEKPCSVPDGGEAECPEPEPVDCVLETVSACVPKYLLPCETAASCGEGFTCELIEECSCSGGGSAPSGGGARPAPEDTPDAGDAFVPADAGSAEPPPDCTCVPGDTSHCVAVKTACTEATEAADCPSGWTCQDNPEGVCFSGPEGSGCTPGDPPKLCAPPFSDLPGMGGRGEGDDAGGEPGGGTPIGLPDGGAEPPTSGSAGKSGNAAENADEPMSNERGGCSVTNGSGASSGALVGFALAMLGLGLLRRRR